MRSYTRTRVVKSNVVEVSIPCLVECQAEEFQFLGNHLAVLRDRGENDPQSESNPDAAGGEKWEPQAVNAKEENGLVTLEKAQAQAQEIKAEAEKDRAQAQMILQQAQAEAAEILKKAQAEAEEYSQKLRDEVSRQAYQEGYSQGLAQGQQEGRAQGAREAEQLMLEAKNILKLAQKAAHEEWRKVDEILLRLALKVAERILRVQIQENPEHLLQRIRALSLLPEERDGWKLHVSSTDYQWLSRLSVDEIGVPLLEDQTLSAGDCFLECSEGIFDARVEAQLARCEQLLREELRHDRLE